MSRILTFLLLYSCLIVSLFFGGQPSHARSTAPKTGLESPQDPHRLKGNPGAGALVDAYGFPITGEQPEKKPVKRLSPGAYGGYGKKEIERPLPKDTDERPLW